MPINKPWTELSVENLGLVPEADGVFELANGQEEIIFIAGTSNLRQSLEEQLDADDPCLEAARLFRYEETFMYTMRESELLQQFIRKHNRLPECNI